MNKTKKIIRYSQVILLITLLSVACSEESLTKLPPQSLPSEIALSSEANVQQVLIGTYDALADNDLLGGDLLMNSELLAADGEVEFTGTFNDPSDIWRKTILTTNFDVREAWLVAYDAINIVNNIEKAIDDGVVETNPGLIRGEVLFIRGLLYFELVKYFGKPYSDGNAASNPGVPIILEPTEGIDDGSFVSRATVQEVYDQAESDLSRAAALLPATNGIFANSVAAYTYLARLYMQKGELSNAQTANDAALAAASGNYTLESNYTNAFNRDENGAEDVFSIQVTSTDGVNDMHTFYAPQNLNGRGDINVTSRHEGFYDPADQRLAFYYDDPTNGRRRVGKWQNQFGNVGTIRLAELYLNRAELEFALNGASTAVDDDVNLIRNRAGLGDITVTSIEQIWLERKLELAHEGHALHDFKRTQGAFYTLEPASGAVDTSGDGLVDGFAYDANELVFPIPDREIQANSNLQQNPGY